MDAEELAATVAETIRLAVVPLRERIAALEATAAAEKVSAGELAGVRERLAVLEVRAPIPGPAGADGAPGANGADGLGLEDLAIEYDGSRTFTLAASAGDRRKELGRFAMPILIYRGVYVAGGAYDPGDVVTYGGSAWHCHKATGARPDTADGAGYWRLMVKRGDRARSS